MKRNELEVAGDNKFSSLHFATNNNNNTTNTVHYYHHAILSCNRMKITYIFIYDWLKLLTFAIHSFNMIAFQLAGWPDQQQRDSFFLQGRWRKKGRKRERDGKWKMYMERPSNEISAGWRNLNDIIVAFFALVTITIKNGDINLAFYLRSSAR